jgi:hypothetical protein
MRMLNYEGWRSWGLAQESPQDRSRCCCYSHLLILSLLDTVHHHYTNTLYPTMFRHNVNVTDQCPTTLHRVPEIWNVRTLERRQAARRMWDMAQELRYLESRCNKNKQTSPETRQRIEALNAEIRFGLAIQQRDSARIVESWRRMTVTLYNCPSIFELLNYRITEL